MNAYTACLIISRSIDYYCYIAACADYSNSSPVDVAYSAFAYPVDNRFAAAAAAASIAVAGNNYCCIEH